jgi:hypothetical protein
VNTDDISYFTNARESSAITKNQGIKVMPFVVNRSGETIYWLSLSLNFDDTPGSIHVREASIKIFTGLESDDAKRLVFRAEWRAVQAPSEKHGQPHWHFHEDARPSIAALAPMTHIERLEPAAAAPSWTQTIQPSSHYHMHYPMASLFHDNNADCVVRSGTVKKLHDWIRLTVEYVHRELREIAA